MTSKTWAGAILGGGIGVGITALRTLHELATDPTAPGGRLAGMERNFPGNDGAVAIEAFLSAISFIALAALAGAVAAKLLSAAIRRYLENRRVSS